MSDSSNTQSPVSGFFQEVQNTLLNKFRGWEQDLPHPGEKGGIRERRVKDFLRTILPIKYGLGSGHVIDSQGKTSFQSDIVIYDAQAGIALPVDNYYSLFPCESVYAVIEVKSELNASDGTNGPSGTIFQCLDANTKLKVLDRNKHNLSPIHYVVFSYTVSWNQAPADKVKNWFENLGKKYDKKLPEVIYILSPGFVLGTSGPTGYNELGIITHVYKRDPLLFFTADLVYRLSQTPVATPNL